MSFCSVFSDMILWLTSEFFDRVKEDLARVEKELEVLKAAAA